MDKPQILVVDDDVFFRTFCSDVLRAQGYEVTVVSTGSEALERAQKGGVALILADIYMSGMTGLELLETVKAQNPALDVVIMTGYASIETAIQALKRGAADYLRKPFAAEELSAVVESTLVQRRLYQENEQLKNQLRLYGISRSFASVDDPVRVLDLGLEALLHVASVREGVCLLSGAGMRFMELVHHRGLGADASQAIRDGFVARGLKHLQTLARVETVASARLKRILGDGSASGYREALLVPLMDRGVLTGAYVLLRDRDGERFSAEEMENARFIGRQVDLSYDSARRIQEARNLAFVDPLTDLYNARYLDIALEKRIAEAKTLGTSFSVLFLDLDYFKDVNDRYGHLTGGKVLIEASRILKANVREEDYVIRYGGDEFTLVLPATDRSGAREVAERIRRSLKDHVFLGREGKSVRLTASIGVATFPDDAQSREELIDQADRAMYRGKEATRDVVYLAGRS